MACILGVRTKTVWRFTGQCPAVKTIPPAHIDAELCIWYLAFFASFSVLFPLPDYTTKTKTMPTPAGRIVMQYSPMLLLIVLIISFFFCKN